jgi:internalin A
MFRNQPLPYWMEYIRHLGGANSPVVVVQNQCDGGRGERANLPVEPAFLSPFEAPDRLFTRVAYSARDDSGRPRLVDALRQAVARLRAVQGQPRMGRNRLAVWDRLRAWRDADARVADQTTRKHRLLPYRDFAALCNSHGVHGPETFA